MGHCRGTQVEPLPGVAPTGADRLRPVQTMGWISNEHMNTPHHLHTHIRSPAPQVSSNTTANSRKGSALRPKLWVFVHTSCIPNRMHLVHKPVVLPCHPAQHSRVDRDAHESDRVAYALIAGERPKRRLQRHGVVKQCRPRAL